MKLIMDKTAGPVEFVIRPFLGSEADLVAILEVYRQCEDFLALGPVATASMEMVLADLELSKKEGCTYCLICSISTGEVLGVIDYSLSGFEGHPETAFLSLLMISAPHREKGLGEAVVRIVEEHIRAGACARGIESGVQVNNPGGIRFWQRMGYRIVSEATPMSDGTTAYRLWKDLP
jgi:ribosomal protein S18 acetylase RimI-like enzyme